MGRFAPRCSSFRPRNGGEFRCAKPDEPAGFGAARRCKAVPKARHGCRATKGRRAKPQDLRRSRILGAERCHSRRSRTTWRGAPLLAAEPHTRRGAPSLAAKPHYSARSASKRQKSAKGVRGKTRVFPRSVSANGRNRHIFKRSLFLPLCAVYSILHRKKLKFWCFGQKNRPL